MTSLRLKYQDRHYSTLKKEEWEELASYGVVNGFGPASNPVLGWFLDRIGPAFSESSPNIHDLCYWQGGDEERRKECDEGFFFRLCQDSLNQGWKSLYYLGLSIVYYCAVRLLGKKYFVYK